MLRTLGYLCLLLFAASVSAETLSGPARAVDGDTLEVAGQSVRLLSIDAPETAQACGAAPCGRAASAHLARAIDGQTVTCTGDTRDAYDRLLAVCSVGTSDLGKLMVLSGHAVVFRRYSDDYSAEESSARAARRGVWGADTFQMPWDYRAARWQSAATTTAPPRSECPIKGNISRSGTRIYHAPWSRHYDRTRIDESRGERWFCSEADALSAGWRAPRG